MIQTFAHVINREKAALGLFVTLAEPTRAMKRRSHRRWFLRKLGITIFLQDSNTNDRRLTDGTKQRATPIQLRGGLTFKKAKKEVSAEQPSELEVNR